MTIPHGPRGRHRSRHGRVTSPAPVQWFHGLFHQGRGGHSVRRGNVRNAILVVLRDEPMHGYQIITELEARTDGRWRPSAGSIYPTLQLLEDEGLIKGEEVDGRRVYRLTDAGRAIADEHPLAHHPWLSGEGDDAMDFRKLVASVLAAAHQVRRSGSEQANAEAREILLDSRRRLYRLLADDGLDTSEATTEAAQ